MVEKKTQQRHSLPTYQKLIVAMILGVIAGWLSARFGLARFAALIGWDVAILVYICWVWWTVLPLDARAAKRHVVREDPGRAVADVLLVVASLASLVAVLFYILEAGHATGMVKVLDITLGLVSVVVSWFLVHTTFALKYARLFYGHANSEVDFNETDLPTYADFAYLAFTLGMTFQVSDTNIRTKEMRGTVLKHALLSYLFGTVIIATTINTLASLS
jgi:uncharacterized membrane protein